MGSTRPSPAHEIQDDSASLYTAHGDHTDSASRCEVGVVRSRCTSSILSFFLSAFVPHSTRHHGGPQAHPITPRKVLLSICKGRWSALATQAGQGRCLSAGLHRSMHHEACELEAGLAGTFDSAWRSRAFPVITGIYTKGWNNFVAL